MARTTRWGLLSALDALRPPLPWPERLLIVGPIGLGDTVLALPMLRRLQRASPGTQVTWVARAAQRPVVEMMGVDAFVASHGGAAGVDVSGFDAMLCLTNEGPAAYGGLARLATVPQRIGAADKRNGPLWWNHVVHASRFGWPRHEAARHLRLLLPFGPVGSTALGALARDATLRAPALPLPADLPTRGHVVMHPFSHGHGREWPLAHWIALANEVCATRPVVFTGSPAEGERFDAAWPPPSRPRDVHAAFGRLDLAQLALLLQTADAALASGTGPVHLAAALGTPTLGLYAPRKGVDVPRWAALGQTAVSVQAQRRCPGGRGRCSNTSCACMAAITPRCVAGALGGGAGRSLQRWLLAPHVAVGPFDAAPAAPDVSPSCPSTEQPCP